MKIIEMGCFKIIPEDLEQRVYNREKEGWTKGSVGLFGTEKDRNLVLLTTLVLRGHPTIEVFFAERTPNLTEIYLIDPQQPRRMSRTDSLRISPRVFIGRTRTFRFLQSWMEHLCDETVTGRMPNDCLNSEMETAIFSKNGSLEAW